MVVLAQRARSVNELVDALEVSQPLVSQHLRILRAAGIVVGNRQGREVIYSLTDDDIVDLVTNAARQSRGSTAGIRAVH